MLNCFLDDFSPKKIVFYWIIYRWHILLFLTVQDLNFHQLVPFEVILPDIFLPPNDHFCIIWYQLVPNEVILPSKKWKYPAKCCNSKMRFISKVYKNSFLEVFLLVLDGRFSLLEYSFFTRSLLSQLFAQNIALSRS